MGWRWQRKRPPTTKKNKEEERLTAAYREFYTLARIVPITKYIYTLWADIYTKVRSKHLFKVYIPSA